MSTTFRGRYRVATAHGGCGWVRAFDNRAEAEAYKTQQERDVGDAESWREGVTRVTLVDMHDRPGEFCGCPECDR